MKNSLGHLGQVVKEFLERHWDGMSPLLLGYSGGPDSKALLYALLNRAPVALAHVDHGWREESREEALLLRQEAEQLGLSFYTTRLEDRTTEDEARVKRLEFFRFLREKIPFQAVLLGHQADDLAETVLKRLFEGAHLTSLHSMSPSSVVDEVPLWRPLLQISKAEIEKWLDERNLIAFRDASNSDPHYLRARMRQTLIPELQESFGKNIGDNLRILSERSRELKEYLDSQVQKISIIEKSFGCWIDGREVPRIELRYFLQRKARDEGFTFTRDVLETLLDWMEEGVINREIGQNGRRMLVDRSHLFILKKNCSILAAEKLSGKKLIKIFLEPEQVRSQFVKNSSDLNFSENARTY